MQLLTKNKKIKIDIQRKNVKNLNLSIFPGCNIRLNVPMNASDEYINDFLSRKENWIKSKIQLLETAKQYDLVDKKIKNGTSIKILGHQYEIILKKTSKNDIKKTNDKIIIQYKNNVSHEKLLNNFLNHEAKLLYEKLLDDLYSIIGKYGVIKPVLKIRKMKARWGSYSRDNNTILVNKELYSASLDCIKYVIIHELTHVLYYNHSKEFYKFLSIHCPDWESCKAKLDYEFVREL